MPKIIDREQKKQEIVRHAWQSISDHGIKGMSVRQIADQAGISSGQMRYYYPDHAALLTAVMAYVKEKVEHRIKEIITSELPIQQKIIEAILATLPLDDDRYADMEVWTAFQMMAQEKGKDTMQDDIRKLVVTALSALESAGVLKAGLDRELTTLRAVALIDGLAMHKLFAVDSVRNDMIEAIVINEVEFWMEAE